MARPLVLLLAIAVAAVSIPLRCAANGAVTTVEEACRQHTKHPAFCVQALSSKPAETETASPSVAALAAAAVSLAAESGAAAVSLVRGLESEPGGMPMECLERCVGKFQAAVAELTRSRAALLGLAEHSQGGYVSAADVARVKGWVKAARADGDTCLDGCRTAEGAADPSIVHRIAELRKLCSVALSLTAAAADAHHRLLPRPYPAAA